MSYKSRSKTYGYSAAKNERSTGTSIFYMLPLLLIVIVMPLLVRVYGYETKLTQFDWYYAVEKDEWVDFFLYYRQQFFVVLSVLMFVIGLYRSYSIRGSLKITKTLVPIALYAVLALLSTVFSNYSEFGYSGIFEQFENVFVLMGYTVTIYYAYLVVETEREVKWILISLCISTLILGLIGVGQTFGHDFNGTSLAKALIVPSELNVDMDITAGAGRAYMTLYNPNYVGVYVSLLLPLLITLLIFTRKIKYIVLYGVTSVLLLISLYGSGSKAGFIAIAVTAVVLLFLLRKPILRQWYLVIPLFTAFIATFLLINQYRDGAYINQITNALKIEKDTVQDISSMETNDDCVSMVYKGNALKISMMNDNGIVTFNNTDDLGNEVAYTIDDSTQIVTLTDERFAGITIQPVMYDNTLSFGIKVNDKTWYFTNQTVDDPGSYYFWTEKGKINKMETAESAIFTEYDSVFSGRGYIWSRSIPLLKKYMILGSGADTFAIAFPQRDYLKLYQNGFYTQVLSKPHCLYLQIGVQTGVLSLIAFLVFYAAYFITCIKIYIRSKFDTFLEQAGAAIFLATIGYMIMGISNDSSITTAPIFWTLIGLGIAINAKIYIANSAKKAADKNNADKQTVDKHTADKNKAVKSL